MQLTSSNENTMQSTFVPKEIHMHPDRFTHIVGDMLSGVRIVRDPTLPLNEIHLIDATHRMIVKVK